jgi:DNA-binding response OmpR family regulator
LEDDLNLAELYREELEDEGYSVLVANDSQMALDLARCHFPEVIVMDPHLRHDVASGEATLEAIQLDTPRSLVVINTAYFSPEVHPVNCAVRALVRKSSDLSELKARIGECLAAQSLVPA